MKLIDLFNKITNGEKLPNKITIQNDTLIYNKDHLLNLQDYYYMDDEEDATWKIWWYDLNDEIEIIEEDKKIEKYDTGLTNGRYTEDSIKTGLDTDTTIENIIINMGIEITLVKEKMFEIIDKINSMEVK